MLFFCLHLHLPLLPAIRLCICFPEDEKKTCQPDWLAEHTSASSTVQCLKQMKIMHVVWNCGKTHEKNVSQNGSVTSNMPETKKICTHSKPPHVFACCKARPENFVSMWVLHCFWGVKPIFAKGWNNNPLCFIRKQFCCCDAFWKPWQLQTNVIARMPFQRKWEQNCFAFLVLLRHCWGGSQFCFSWWCSWKS